MVHELTALTARMDPTSAIFTLTTASICHTLSDRLQSTFREARADLSAIDACLADIEAYVAVFCVSPQRKNRAIVALSFSREVFLIVVMIYSNNVALQFWASGFAPYQGSPHELSAFSTGIVLLPASAACTALTLSG